MSSRWKKAVGIGVVAAALPAVVGLSAVSAKSDTLQRAVPLDGAQSARIELRLDAGTLKLGGGGAASDLLGGSFEFDHDDGRPEIDYQVMNSRGELTIEPEGDGHLDWPWDIADQTTWDLTLNQSIPTDLTIDVEAGKADLKLGGTSVTTLEVNADAAKATVDLSGVWSHDLTADLGADAGQLIVVVPTDVGVRIEADVDAGDLDVKGLHEIDDHIYVNDAYETSAVTLSITAEVDAGQLKIETA